MCAGACLFSPLREALVVGMSDYSVEQSSASAGRELPGWQRHYSRAATLCETWPRPAIQATDVAQSHTIWLGARAAVPTSVTVFSQREVRALVATTSAEGAWAEGV